KEDVKCKNPWLSIVTAAHPSTITTILKDENNQAGADGLFARFIFYARVSPEDVHKRRKREIDNVTGEYAPESYRYPSLTHIMYFLYLMHHNEMLKLNISDAARPRLEYLTLDDCSAESIQKMAKLVQQNINEYLTISPEITLSAIELMTFYIETKNLCMDFP
ncbi:unnamed protein product, partial [Rotaria magnacalcarata]